MNSKNKFVAAVAAVVLSIALLGCGDNDAVARRKLDAILTSDLAVIVSDIPKAGLADSIYYSLVSYQTYKTGDYTKKAVVDFYFMRGIKVKITRKYRFVKEAGMWERYYNVYNFIEDSAQKATTDDSAVVGVPVQKK